MKPLRIGYLAMPAFLREELRVVDVDVDVAVIRRAVLLAFVEQAFEVERIDVVVERGQARQPVDRLYPAGLDPSAKAEIADVEAVRLAPRVEQGHHLLAVEIEIERRVNNLEIGILLHEALDVRLDDLRLERPAGVVCACALAGAIKPGTPSPSPTPATADAWSSRRRDIACFRSARFGMIFLPLGRSAGRSQRSNHSLTEPAVSP